MMPAGLDPKRTLVVVDLSGWLHKAWHVSVGILRADDTTGERYLKMASMVIGWLVALLSDPCPAMVAVAVDSVGETIRHKRTAMFDPDRRYKAGRIRKPADFYGTSNRILEIIAMHRVPILAAEQWEADDVFATVKAEAAKLGCYVVFLTIDKDIGQLVDDTTFLWDGTAKGGLVRAADIEARWQVPPSLLRDLLAVMGDNSDNIKGVPGLGLEKASAVLRHHGSLEKALQTRTIGPTPQEIKDAEKARAKAKKAGDEAALAEATTALEVLRTGRDIAAWTAVLQEHHETVTLACELVTLDAAAPILWDPDDLPVGGFDVEELREAYLSLGFGALAKEVRHAPKARYV